jgi:hypothetical protein
MHSKEINWPFDTKDSRVSGTNCQVLIKRRNRRSGYYEPLLDFPTLPEKLFPVPTAHFSDILGISDESGGDR